MSEKIPLIDLVAQYQSIQSEIDAAILRVLKSGQFILGPEVAAFEAEVANYIGVEYSIGVASGTDALILSLRALDIGPGDEVILPAYTFFATVGAVLTVGAKPVFVDINLDNYCIDTNQIPEKITSKTKAIIPVHLFGHPAEMGILLEIAHHYHLRVVEDNAQAFGAEYNGKRTGSFGDIGCLSFFPSKNLGGFGDGGMVVTGDRELAARIKVLRTHGWKRKYFPKELGYNSRLDALQAAILRAKLAHVDEWNNRRREIAGLYNRALADFYWHIPHERPLARHVFHLYAIRIKGRDQIRQYLKQEGIASGIYYPMPPYLAEPCHSLGNCAGDFPCSDQVSREMLALPLYPEMSSNQQGIVINALLTRQRKSQVGF